MKTIIRNILAFILGWFIGSFVNLGLVNIGYTFFPIAGLDPNDFDALIAIIPTLEFKNFVFPFLAHSLGTLVGAIVVGLLAASHKMKLSIGIGGFFLIGGIIMNFILPGPMWFEIADLILAYIPMAWFGGKIAIKLTEK